MSGEQRPVIIYDPEKINIYNTYLNFTRNEENKVRVFTSITRDGFIIPIILKTKYLTRASDAYKTHLGILIESYGSEWACTECKERNHKLTGYIDGDMRPIVCRPENVQRNPEQITFYKSNKTHIENYIKETNAFNTGKWVYEIVTTDTLFTDKLYMGTDTETKTELMHYSYVPTTHISMVEYNTINKTKPNNCFKNNYVMYEKALNKYATLLFGMFNKCEMTPELLKSFNMILVILSGSTYGKQQIPAVKWFIKIFDRLGVYKWNDLPPSSKIQLVIDTILNSPVTEGENKSPFIGYYHTINETVFNFLENGTSEKSVISMIEKINAPSSYMRKTAPPKKAHIAKAKMFCSTMENTILTTSELEQYPKCHKVKSPKDEENNMEDAFAIMEQRLKHKNKYSGFASRVNAPSISTPPRVSPTTLSGLIELVKGGDITKLESRPHGSAYLAKTTLLPDDLANNMGHLWLFLNNDISRWGGPATWNEITHVYEVKTSKRHNYHFIVKNSRGTLKNKPVTLNCTLPEFLAPKHHSAKSVFEELGKLTNIKIPLRGEIALGMGASVAKESVSKSYKELTSSMTFRINGTNIVTIKQG